MNMVSALLLLLSSVAWTLPAVSSVNVTTGQNDKFPYHAQLDPHYRLFWRFNSTHITFETVVNTTGYVAFGISPNGKMHPSDVIVGGVKDGVPYFRDSHTTGYAQPLTDKSQDWILLSASEASGVTVLRFTRKLETCDDDDRPILEGTTRVIYAYHSADPTSSNDLSYHGSDRRGAKSLLLLDPPPSAENVTADTSDVKTLDFFAKNFTIPASDTTYRCTTFLLPDLDKKHHVIKYEPIIQPGNEKLVHHLVISACTEPVSDDFVGMSYDCYVERPPQFKSCYSFVVAWAIGGKEFVFPDHVGYPLGPGEPRFYILEMHYDNPGLKTGIQDNSGIRIHMTPRLRQHDAGLLLIGASVNKKIIIPPLSDGWVTTAHCNSECLEGAMDDASVGEIHVFANFLHSHLLGRGLTTRVIRGNTELPPLAQDNNYDFDYQEMRSLHKEYTIKKGDRLMVDCLYKSSHKSEITYGGLRSRDEMCESFPMYYPRIPLSFVESEPLWNNLPIGETDELVYVNKLDFTKAETHKNFTELYKNSDIKVMCGSTSGAFKFHTIKPSEVEPGVPYVHPSQCPAKK